MFRKNKLYSLILGCYFYKGDIQMLICSNKHTGNVKLIVLAVELLLHFNGYKFSAIFFHCCFYKGSFWLILHVKIYICVHFGRDADISMVLQCTRKYQVLMDGYIICG